MARRNGGTADSTDVLGQSLMDYERDLRRIAASFVPFVARLGTQEAIEAIADLVMGADQPPEPAPVAQDDTEVNVDAA